MSRADEKSSPHFLICFRICFGCGTHVTRSSCATILDTDLLDSTAFTAKEYERRKHSLMTIQISADDKALPSLIKDVLCFVIGKGDPFTQSRAASF